MTREVQYQKRGNANFEVGSCFHGNTFRVCRLL